MSARDAVFVIQRDDDSAHNACFCRGGPSASVSHVCLRQRRGLFGGKIRGRGNKSDEAAVCAERRTGAGAVGGFSLCAERNDFGVRRAAGRSVRADAKIAHIQFPITERGDGVSGEQICGARHEGHKSAITADSHLPAGFAVRRATVGRPRPRPKFSANNL